MYPNAAADSHSAPAPAATPAIPAITPISTSTLPAATAAAANAAHTAATTAAAATTAGHFPLIISFKLQSLDASGTLSNNVSRAVDRVVEEILRGKNKESFNGLVFPTHDTPIGPLREPVLFADAITMAFDRQGSWTMHLDTAYIGFPPQSSRDDLTSFKAAVLKRSYLAAATRC